MGVPGRIAVRAIEQLLVLSRLSLLCRVALSSGLLPLRASSGVPGVVVRQLVLLAPGAIVEGAAGPLPVAAVRPLLGLLAVCGSVASVVS